MVVTISRGFHLNQSVRCTTSSCRLPTGNWLLLPPARCRLGHIHNSRTSWPNLLLTCPFSGGVRQHTKMPPLRLEEYDSVVERPNLQSQTFLKDVLKWDQAEWLSLSQRQTMRGMRCQPSRFQNYHMLMVRHFCSPSIEFGVTKGNHFDARTTAVANVEKGASSFRICRSRNRAAKVRRKPVSLTVFAKNLWKQNWFVVKMDRIWLCDNYVTLLFLCFFGCTHRYMEADKYDPWMIPCLSAESCPENRISRCLWLVPYLLHWKHAQTTMTSFIKWRFQKQCSRFLHWQRRG